MIVSNDEMRDHIFQMLAPKFFLKWKQRHQVGVIDVPSISPFEDHPAVKFRCCTQFIILQTGQSHWTIQIMQAFPGIINSVSGRLHGNAVAACKVEIVGVKQMGCLTSP